jgi:anti-anti-sigma factor
VSGDLDTPAIPRFLKWIDDAISEAVRTLVIDLSRVDFVSISAVQALVDVHDRANCNGMALLLVTDGFAADYVLKVTGMADYFTCYPSVRAAVDARRAELISHYNLDMALDSSE